MRVHITGPRSDYLNKDHGLDYIGIDLDMDTIPDVGETLIIDNGSSYEVERRMFWVRTVPEGPYSGDLKGNGEVQAMHLDIQPRGHAERRAAEAEGRKVMKGELSGFRTLVNGDVIIDVTMSDGQRRAEVRISASALAGIAEASEGHTS